MQSSLGKAILWRMREKHLKWFLLDWESFSDSVVSPAYELFKKGTFLWYLRQKRPKVAQFPKQTPTNGYSFRFSSCSQCAEVCFFCTFCMWNLKRISYFILSMICYRETLIVVVVWAHKKLLLWCFNLSQCFVLLNIHVKYICVFYVCSAVWLEHCYLIQIYRSECLSRPQSWLVNHVFTASVP